MNSKNRNSDFGRIRNELINSDLICIEIPPCEIDIHNNCYWLEEAQGDTTENFVKKCQIKLYFERANKRMEITIGVERTVYKSTKQIELLYNLNYIRNSNLIVKEINEKLKAINPASYMTRLNFKVTGIELWNVKENLINVYVNEEHQLGNILILKDVTGKEIYIEGFESDDQENCLKLSIIKEENKNIHLKKEYEWEAIELINKASK